MKCWTCQTTNAVRRSGRTKVEARRTTASSDCSAATHRGTWYICMSVCKPVCLSTHVFVHPSTCLSTHLSAGLSAFSLICLSIPPPVCLITRPSLRLSVHQSVCLSAHLAVCLRPPVSLVLRLSLHSSVCLSLHSLHMSVCPPLLAIFVLCLVQTTGSDEIHS